MASLKTLDKYVGLSVKVTSGIDDEATQKK